MIFKAKYIYRESINYAYMQPAAWKGLSNIKVYKNSIDAAGSHLSPLSLPSLPPCSTKPPTHYI